MNCEHLSEVFKNENGGVYQCNVANCYWLDFNGEQSSFSVSDFLRFKRAVDEIDVASLLIDAARSSDYTLLMPYRCSRCFLLSALDVIKLRELLAGARVMLELNSLLSVCLKARPARVLA